MLQILYQKVKVTSLQKGKNYLSQGSRFSIHFGVKKNIYISVRGVNRIDTLYIRNLNLHA